MTTRKTYANNSELAHAWAHQRVNEGNTPGGNRFHFYRGRCYSYSTCIARIVSAPNGENVYLINGHNYSHMTCKHQREVRNAIPTNCLVFESCTENGFPDGWNNTLSMSDYAYFIVGELAEVQEQLSKLKRARTSQSMYRLAIRRKLYVIRRFVGCFNLDKAVYRDDLEKRSTIFGYMDCKNARFFKKAGIKALLNICRKSGLFDNYNDKLRTYAVGGELDITRATEYVIREYFDTDVFEKIQKKEAQMRAEARRMEIERRKRKMESEIDKINRWRKGANLYLGYCSDTINDINGGNVVLRIKDSFIESSKGIKMTFAEGRNLWNLLKAYESGIPFRKMPVHATSADFLFREYRDHVAYIGCHNIAFKECKAIAEQMNWL